MFSKDALLFALIVMCIILFIVWLFDASDNYELKNENEKLKAELSNALESNKQYYTLSTHQQMQERSFKIYGLEKMIEGRNKHIDELTCKLNVQYRITSTLMEELSNERIKNKQLLDSTRKNVKDLFETRFMQGELNKECGLKQQGTISPAKEDLLKRYKKREKDIYAIQFDFEDLDQRIKSMSDIGVEVILVDYQTQKLSIKDNYSKELGFYTVNKGDYITRVNGELKLLSKNEFRKLYEIA